MVVSGDAEGAPTVVEAYPVALTVGKKKNIP
jgi:hypothetical protein